MTGRTAEFMACISGVNVGNQHRYMAGGTFDLAVGSGHHALMARGRFMRIRRRGKEKSAAGMAGNRHIFIMAEGIRDVGFIITMRASQDHSVILFPARLISEACHIVSMTYHADIYDISYIIISNNGKK